MIRPDRSCFVRFNGIDVYHSTAYQYRWYLIPEGEIKKKKEGDRPIVWARSEDDTYYVCPSCRALNRIDQRSGPLTIFGPDLDANTCEVCSSCGSHAWFSLLNWTPRRYHGSIRLHPRKCPKCRKPVSEAIPTYDTHFRTGRQADHHRFACYGCQLLWRTS